MHKSVIGLIGIGVVIILMSVIMSGAEKFGHRSPPGPIQCHHGKRADNRHCRHTGIAVEGIDFIRADDHIQLCVRLPVMRAGFRK